MYHCVTHTTTYAYEELVSICHKQMRLEPRGAPRRSGDHARDRANAGRARDRADYFGNRASFTCRSRTTAWS
jgi:hypothetical protein